MLTRNEIRSITLSLEVSEQMLLFVFLDSAGRVQRLGDGERHEHAPPLREGHSDQHLFESLLDHVSDELLEHTGFYELPDPSGERCRLQIILQAAGERADGYEFVFGSESEGPPTEISDFVVTALDLTELWYSGVPDTGSQDDADESEGDESDDDEAGD